MPSPHLYVDNADIARIKANLQTYPWYAAAYENIHNECETMLRRGFSVPCELGYVFYNSCKRDNQILIFDPYDPKNHVCPKCGMNYRDEPFQLAWNCSYHQWLAQMSLKLGICYIVSGDERFAGAVRKMLLEYVDRYPGYENNDNELGTTRIFQSTYIESVWLSYIAGGYDMTCASGCYTAEDRRRVLALFGESASVIRDYDEKWNNRQAFNNSGMLAAAILREDGELYRYTLEGPHGFINHMKHSVLEDGFWYEGDNYHFATVPSLVNMAEMCLHNGRDLYHCDFDGHALEDMFAAPLMTLQPDGSFPSRKDSPYASTFSQRWYSGLYELAHRRYDGDVFTQALLQMYANVPSPEQELLNAAGLMDVFEKTAAQRSLLDWRGFLTAEPALELKGQPASHRSVDMRGTGLAVLRQDRGTSYLSVDYGHYGGGHGHPDRLAMTWFARGRRWLSDFGTGNYYFDHLRWYRSTIGHNTVAVDGKNHLPAEGKCLLLESGSRSAATDCRVEGIAPGVAARRTCVLIGDGLLLDVFRVESSAPHRYDYALHGFGELSMAGAAECPPLKGVAYSFLSEWRRSDALEAVFDTSAAQLRIHFAQDDGLVLRGARAYGPPTKIPTLFPVLIATQNAETTAFAALMEDVPSGSLPRAMGVRKAGENGFRIDCADGGWIQVRLDDGVCVLWGRGDRTEAFEAFHTHCVEDVCRFACAPAAAEGRRTADGLWRIDVHGRCGVVAPLAPLQIGNAQEQRQLAAELLDNRVFEGLQTKLTFSVVNGGPEPAALTDADFQAQDGVQYRVEPVTLAAGERRSVPVTVRVCGAKHPWLALAGCVYPLEVQPLFEAEAYVDYCSPDAPVKVEKRSHSVDRLRFSTSFAGEMELAGGEVRSISLTMEHPAVHRDEGKLRFDYAVRALDVEVSGCLNRALVVPDVGDLASLRNGAATNLIMADQDHVARTEKRWQGTEDLSATGTLMIHGEEGLALRLRVKDGCVLFDGGKFPFDNDSVELFVDRRGAEYRHEDFMPDGCYGVQFLGGRSGDVSWARPLGGSLRAPEKIAVAMEQLPDGYELVADIPFECLGGRPEAGELWGFDLLVNDRDSGVRRDQQLIWSGCAEKDERIYLREDHHDPRRFGLLHFSREKSRRDVCESD